MLLVELLLFFHQSVGSIVPANFVEPQYLQEYLVWNNQWTNESWKIKIDATTAPTLCLLTSFIKAVTPCYLQLLFYSV